MAKKHVASKRKGKQALRSLTPLTTPVDADVVDVKRALKEAEAAIREFACNLKAILEDLSAQVRDLPNTKEES